MALSSPLSSPSSHEASGSTSKLSPATSVLADDAQPPPAKKIRWRPTQHLRPAAPPPPDQKLIDEMAAQQAAQSLGYEGRRIKKFMQRRTVDYWGTIPRWALRRHTATLVRSAESSTYPIFPSSHQIVNLLPPAAYDNPSTSLATTLIHTSTNKIRCPVNVVRWMPDARRLLTGSTSGEFTLWNGLTFNFETIMQAHDSAVRAFEWSKSGNWLISSDQNGTIKYFQSNMNNLQAFQGHRESVRALSFSPDDARFVSASDDSTMKVWNFDDAREEKSLTGHGWDVKCVEWHRTKGMIVSGSKDNLVKFWDPRSNTVLGTFHGHKNTVQACKWSPDGNMVATASRDQVLKVFDIRAMNEIYTLKGHQKEVCSVDWHPVHQDTLVSGGSEGAVLFWSLRSATPDTPVHTMPDAHESNVWSLQWHPLGHILASGSNDHTTRFWSRARPADGREGAEGKNEEKQRWNAKRGGDDWDDDFIPGLTSANRSFIPQTGDTSASSISVAPSFGVDAMASANAMAAGFGGGAGSNMGHIHPSRLQQQLHPGPPPPPPSDDYIPGLSFNRPPPPQRPPQPPPGGAYGSFYGGGGGGGAGGPGRW
ncbi:uncharacterized protein PFL1_00571 [Pseudozyma flocculosa PF-1]|uniref:Polyadenylation factor subunit 2 n=1 Tax=Pseudozyma flocculosa TaxID=84751 RepID=A0A5C3EQR3_9BASI|nr:uncharacterized protein PFL1_00571 [Pseudozyma flocculosa PF-1]EPQ32375.1 hypothetical protein PFL1_00571 [Pseudozyma flocculosa PF-1]SPO34653.1 related to PFS2 - polyadenylation factor I subunit 2 [Pseudozyma flocculosa]